MTHLYPIRLHSSLHETIWGGRRLEVDNWKVFTSDAVAIGESWETEISNVVLNGDFEGKSLKELVTELGPSLLGTQAIAIFGPRFPLLAKFIDANAQLSVQVHPDDSYAHTYEQGKLGKTEFWYILSADPGATIVHGFKANTDSAEVKQAINTTTLEDLMHEEPVSAGDVVFVPAGTVHAIGSGILLYELQEYSDVTYRMYDYGRLSADGKPRELHIDRSLDVTTYEHSSQVKVNPVLISDTPAYTDRCLVACQYFVTHELTLKGDQVDGFTGQTTDSCAILSSLGAEMNVRYGAQLELSEPLLKGQTIVLPAALGAYRLEGTGPLLLSYVPTSNDPAWQAWRASNPAYAR